MSENADTPESDLITVTKLGSIWLVSKIFGLFPLMGMSSGAHHSKSSNAFCGDLIYTFLWIGLYLISFGLSITVNPVSFTGQFPLVCVVGVFIHIYIAFTAALNSYALTPSKGKLLYFIWHRIETIDKSLCRISKSSHDYFSFAKKSTRFQNIYISLGALVMAAAAVYDNWIFKDLYGKYSVIICFAYIFPYIVSSLVILQFISIINLVLIRLKFINCLLNDILSEDIKVPSVFNLTAIRPIFFVVDKKLNNKLKSQAKQTENVDTKGLNLHLDRIFYLHDQLVELCEISNENYSTQLVTFVTGAFVIIIFGLFFELKVLFWVWNQQTLMFLYAGSYLYWAIFYIILVYILLNMCTRTRDEARESAFIAHKILQRKPLFMWDDDTFYNKMKSFTLQLLHRRNTFNFHGLGLFALDYTFIFSSVSAATSYLIVLLQFDMSAQ